jgi:hypothetical protein
VLFERPIDLELYYKNVHNSLDENGPFSCDYPGCDRATTPFVQKNELRDHIRDFHKEDNMFTQDEKTETDWEKWITERAVFPDNWLFRRMT